MLRPRKRLVLETRRPPLRQLQLQLRLHPQHRERPIPSLGRTARYPRIERHAGIKVMAFRDEVIELK